MLINLYVDNFRGIVKPINLSAIASNKIKRNNSEYIQISNNKRILKSICIIGSNGSGKTSILSAIDTIKAFLSFPTRKNVNSEKDFKEIINNLDSDNIKKLFLAINTLTLGEQNVDRINDMTKIEIEIYVPNRENNIPGIYLYKLYYDKNYSSNGVLLEELSYKENININDYKILFSLNNIMESEIGTALLYENNDNIVISSRDNGNIKYYKSFFNELLIYTNNISENRYFDGEIINLYNLLKEKFVELCNICDDKIVDVTLEENQVGKKYLLFWNSNNNSLKFSQLSAGTKKTILLGGKLLSAINNNSLILIDELETKLHHTLSLFLIRLISDSKKSHCAQIIFTTHSATIAFEMKNDQLYFIENHNNNYNFMSIATAINSRLITKDKNPVNAWLEDILIKNPSLEKINKFINEE